MSFLDVIPHSLFRTLSSPVRIRNAEALARIFGQFFDDFNCAPKKAEVLQVIRQVLEDPVCAQIAEDAQGTSPSEAAEYVIYNRLREDGWIMEVVDRRNVEVHMPREAHALMSALITLQEELKVNISAEASLIDSGILAAYEDPAGKVMNIASARRQSIQLRRAIDGVLTSLHRIEEDLMKSDGLADLLTKFMERFVDKLLLQNYRQLKASSYNPMRFQRSIRANTERFMSDDGQVSRAAVALADQGLAADVKSAQVQIRQDLSRIRDVFINLGEKLDLIDRFSHKLERRIATTVRYQETARNVREESVRNCIRLAFARLDAGETTCITPLVGLPLAYSTPILATPKQAREPVQPEKRLPKSVDPADLMREAMIDGYVAAMAVTPNVVAARLRAIADSETFVDLNAFEPENAQDVAILYEARSGAFDELPGLEIRSGETACENRFITGPSLLIRRREDQR
jgi:Family of unknown function (DUF5716)